MNYRALDYHFSVWSDDLSVEEEITRLFRALSDTAPADHSFRITRADSGLALELDGQLLDEPGPLDQTLDRLVGEINAAAVASRPGDLLLHAATVSRDGLGVVIPGAPGSGKSTMAQSLVGAGFEYLSDEVAAVDPDSLLVAPYPKPLSVAEGLVPVEGSRLPVQVGAIVFPSYSQGAPAALEPISRAEAAIELAHNAFNFLGQGRTMLPVLRRVVLSSWCGRLRIGDRSSAAPLVVRMVEDWQQCLTS